MRPCFCTLTSEGITKRELDQARRTHGRDNLAERALVLEIGRCWVSKVRVVPDVEEICRKPQLLALRNGEVLDQRKIPVLLEGATVEVAPQVAETGGASVVVDCAASRVGQRRLSEVVDVHVAIQPAMDVARGVAGRN